MLKENGICAMPPRAKQPVPFNLKKSLIAGGLGFAVTIGVCLLFSWLMCQGAVNPDMAGFFAYSALFAGGTAAAFLAAGKTRKMLEALPACGVILMLLVVCGLLFFGGMRLSAFFWAMLVLSLAAFCGCALSGLRK